MNDIRLFETRDRYYKLFLYRDLLNDLVIFQCWGGKHNSMGGHKTLLVKDLDEGHKLMEQIATNRIKRDYVEIIPTPPKIIKKSISKKSDLLDPKKYLLMLARCQSELPHLFKKEITPQQFCSGILERFPEYSKEEVSLLLKQYLATPIFLGHTIH